MYLKNRKCECLYLFFCCWTIADGKQENLKPIQFLSLSLLSHCIWKTEKSTATSPLSLPLMLGHLNSRDRQTSNQYLFLSLFSCCCHCWCCCCVHSSFGTQKLYPKPSEILCLQLFFLDTYTHELSAAHNSGSCT